MKPKKFKKIKNRSFETLINKLINKNAQMKSNVNAILCKLN